MIRATVATVAAGVALAVPSSASACLIACHVRHPVHAWEFKHHLRYCDSWRCEAKRAVEDDNGRSRPHVKRRHPYGTYPCVYRWRFHGRPYWRLHYRVGGGRYHVGVGVGVGYPTCLSWQ